MSGHGLAPHETALQGRLSDEITGEPDAVERRIRRLVAECLVPLASASGGWDWLFRDPRDGRLWEQTFPLGSLHGPGPRRLQAIEPDVALEKYGALRDG
jgi:hypothetical protein